MTESHTHRQFNFHDGEWWDDWNGARVSDSGDFFDAFNMDAASAILPICGCNAPGELVDAMAAYLRRTGDRDQRSIREGEHHLADYLLACMADDIGLTEHGSNIAWSWLTPAGEAWLGLIRVGGIAAVPN